MLWAYLEKKCLEPRLQMHKLSSLKHGKMGPIWFHQKGNKAFTTEENA